MKSSWLLTVAVVEMSFGNAQLLCLHLHTSSHLGHACEQNFVPDLTKQDPRVEGKEG